jgi:hypothetical protein
MSQRLKLIVLCLFVFICAFSVQCFIWIHIHPDYLDENYWVHSVEKIYAGQKLTPKDLTFGYPASPFLYVGEALMYTKFEPATALRISLALFLALSITGIACLLFMLRPHTWWWIISPLILTIHYLYHQATPPSALLSLFSVLLILLVLLTEEKRDHIHLRQIGIILLGIVMGISLSTRFDISVIIGLCILPYLWILIKKRIWLPITLSLITFGLLNPNIVLSPIYYFSAVLEKIHTHISSVPNLGSWSYSLIVLTPSLISFMWLMCLLLFKKELLPFSKRYTSWILSMTIVIGILLLVSPYHPLWYFYPLLFIWETCIPLLVETTLRSTS